jgi:hypothetical protein
MKTGSLSPLLLMQTLAREAGWIEALSKTVASEQLREERTNLLKHVLTIGKSGNLELIVATEKTFIEGDLEHYVDSEHYANSAGRLSSLNAAMAELNATEKLLEIVDNKQEYSRVDAAYSLSKNRESGLPLDEARQAFKSHYARLNNLDKSRLSVDEKALVDARKSNIYTAGKLYAKRQAKTLGV